MKLVVSLVLLFLVMSANSVKAQKPVNIKAKSPVSRRKNVVKPYDWGIIYYMSYDNNLEYLGKGIIEAIRAGVKSPRTIAAVQADFTDAGGMYRYTIKSTGMRQRRIASDDSANEEQFISYLAWFAKKYPSKQYIIIFLNHGGGVDEMCFDENPDTEGKRWMSGRILGEKLRQFREKMAGDWKLLFLQQCGRGSLENLYSFRGTANFIMSSPIDIGAPNTYYTALHQWLGKHPNATGREVAAKISAEDRDYTIYTCLRTEKLTEVPSRLNAAISPLLNAKTLVAPIRQRIIYSTRGEVTYDLKRYFEQLAVTNAVEGTNQKAFFNWIREELFTDIWFRDGQHDSEYSGLSIFQPETEDELLRHSKLDLYKESKLSTLWKMRFSAR